MSIGAMAGLAGKVALITGASSGIGAAVAKKFASHGAKLIMVGRDSARLNSVAEDCKKLSSSLPEPVCLAVDISTSSGVDSLVSSFKNLDTKLDVLINNAGIIEFGSIENTSVEQYDRVMNINIRSMYELTNKLVPDIVATKGNIINISSVNGIRAFPGLVAYNVSKSAVDQFTRCTALELAPKGVRVNCINPGVIITELQKRGGLDEEKYQKFLERSCETHALGRPGTAEEVASAVSFLADNSQSSFITGVSLPVDGGRHAMCPR